MARRAKSLWSREARLAGAAGHMKGRAWSQPLRALLDLLRADLFSEPQAPSTVAGSQGVGQKGLKGALPWGGAVKATSTLTPATYPADARLSESGHLATFPQHTTTRWAVRHTGSRLVPGPRENAL